jgi:hypothetical protein
LVRTSISYIFWRSFMLFPLFMRVRLTIFVFVVVLPSYASSVARTVARGRRLNTYEYIYICTHAVFWIRARISNTNGETYF